MDSPACLSSINLMRTKAAVVQTTDLRCHDRAFAFDFEYKLVRCHTTPDPFSATTTTASKFGVAKWKALSKEKFPSFTSNSRNCSLFSVVRGAFK